MRHAYAIGGLALLNVFVFAQTANFEFVAYDDYTYILENPNLEGGLTWQNLWWGLTSGYFVNWHPVTWWSYLLDFELYGLDPRGYHVTNVVIHILASGAFYLALYRFTERFAESVLVAALFAIHPQHVQSVAWVSERKDVLSGLFMALTLLAYHRYTITRSSRNYSLTLLLFAFGLMSKPMLVTLPCVLLLLDYWPLNRLHDRESLRFAMLEKIPFFVMALVSSIVTARLQTDGEASATVERFGYDDRLVNAVVTYGAYAYRTFWPFELSFFYPLFPDALPYGLAGLSFVCILLFTAMGIYFRKTYPAMLIGWLWFIGMLVPVIGLLHVGAQSSADRYTYLPLIGFFIALVFPLYQKFGVTDRGRTFLYTVSGCLVIVLALTAHRETSYWRNTTTLAQRGLEVRPDNYMASYMLGWQHQERGEITQAEALYRDSIAVSPRFVKPHVHLGNIHQARGDYAQAIPHFEKALEGRRDEMLLGHQNLGMVYYAQKNFDAAANHFEEALIIEPEEPAATVGLAQVFIERGEGERAVAMLERCIETHPDTPEAYYNLGRIATSRENYPEARRRYEEALSLDATRPETYASLGNVLAWSGDIEGALARYDSAIALDASYGAAYVNKASALYSVGRLDEALKIVEECLEFAPDYAPARRLYDALMSEL